MRLSLAPALFLAAGVAHASVGESSLQFLRLDVGPRQAAMGGAGVALLGDAYGAAYNPALLSALPAQELAVSHAEWLTGIRYQDFAYGRPTRLGTFGARLQRLDYGSFAGYDAGGAPAPTVGASDLLVAASFAHALSPDWSVGITMKMAREEIAGVSAQAILADAGALYTLRSGWFEDVSLGASVRNFGSRIKFDSESNSAPAEALIGASRPFLSDAFTVAADLRLPQSQGPRAHVGGEAWLSESVALRVGFELPQDEGIGIRAGVGFRFQKVQIDYAFSPLGSLGQTHHMALHWRFGGLSESAYNAGMRLMSEGKNPQAILKFNEALNLDPKNSKAARRLTEAYERLKRESGETPGAQRK